MSVTELERLLLHGEPDNELCHVYCSICHPGVLPPGYVHYCGTPEVPGDGVACDETCLHVMCLVCLEDFDHHHQEAHG